jgi:hypothetical protein
MRTKHRNDSNHAKRGWVGGNPRYSSKAPTNMRGWHPADNRLAAKKVLRDAVADR